MGLAADLIEARLALDLRATWQARALLATDGRMNRIVMSVLAHNFDEAMLTLLRVVYPGFSSITAPFLCSAAKISKRGNVVADMVWSDGSVIKDMVLFVSEIRLRDAFRELADKLRLDDEDRVQMFQAVKNWVVADRRLDPTMDPQDPDAKRLVN